VTKSGFGTSTIHSSSLSLAMKFDPGNKYFIATFAVIVLGVIGFLIASIFIDVSGDVVLKKIGFKRSSFLVKVAQLKSDKSYVVQVYNGEWQ
jgi:hypothetical protein